MKQTITPKQLNELSEKGKDKLWEWSYEKGYMDTDKELGMWKIPLLSIGQMIEFLQEYKDSPFLVLGLVSLFKDGKIDIKTLWEAVKEVLEK